MGALTGLLLSQGLSAGAGLAGSVMAARSQRAEGRYQKAAYDVNARMAEIQAQDALARGDQQAGAVRRDAKGLAGSQRAALAAQGVTGETPSQIIGETAMLGEIDADQVRANAWREAWGYRQQADEYRKQGKMAQKAARNQAKSTILTGGLQFAQGLMGMGQTLGKVRATTGTHERASQAASGARRTVSGWSGW